MTSDDSTDLTLRFHTISWEGCTPTPPEKYTDKIPPSVRIRFIPRIYSQIARKLNRELSIRAGEITLEHVARVAAGDYSVSHPVEARIANELKKRKPKP